MTEPFVFIATYSIDEGKLDEYLAQHTAYVDFVEANEPRLIDFRAYLNRDRTEVTHVYVYPDAPAADFHLQVAREQIGRGLRITRPTRLEVYGAPGPVLQQALKGNGEAGAAVSVKEELLSGISRPPIGH